jgi:hypothetical protein
MWAGGIAICSYLFFSPENAVAAGTPPLITIAKDLKNANLNLQDNDAYVFINVNEKHFLTRFVASVPAEEIKTEVKKSNKEPGTAMAKTTVEKVSKKIRPATVTSNVTGFTIKAVPGS